LTPLYALPPAIAASCAPCAPLPGQPPVVTGPTSRTGPTGPTCPTGPTRPTARRGIIATPSSLCNPPRLPSVPLLPPDPHPPAVRHPPRRGTQLPAERQTRNSKLETRNAKRASSRRGRRGRRGNTRRTRPQIAQTSADGITPPGRTAPTRATGPTCPTRPTPPRCPAPPSPRHGSSHHATACWSAAARRRFAWPCEGERTEHLTPEPHKHQSSMPLSAQRPGRAQAGDPQVPRQSERLVVSQPPHDAIESTSFQDPAFPSEEL